MGHRRSFALWLGQGCSCSCSLPGEQSRIRLAAPLLEWLTQQVWGEAQVGISGKFPGDSDVLVLGTRL